MCKATQCSKAQRTPAHRGPLCGLGGGGRLQAVQVIGGPLCLGGVGEDRALVLVQVKPWNTVVGSMLSATSTSRSA